MDNISKFILIFIFVIFHCNNKDNNQSKDKLINACIAYGLYCSIKYDTKVDGNSKTTVDIKNYSDCLEGKDLGLSAPPFAGCAYYNEFRNIIK